MKPIAILGAFTTGTSHAQVYTMKRSLHNIGVPTVAMKITATEDPITAGDETKFSAVVLLYANRTVATHQSYMDGTRNVPVLCIKTDAVTMNDGSGITTGANTGGMGPLDYFHVDDENGNRIYGLISVEAVVDPPVAASYGSIAYVLKATGRTILPGPGVSGPIGFETSSFVWEKLGTTYPTWYCSMYNQALWNMLALRISTLDVEGYPGFETRLDIDDYKGMAGYDIYGATLDALMELMIARNSYIIAGMSWAQIGEIAWQKALQSYYPHVRPIVHNHVNEYWRTDNDNYTPVVGHPGFDTSTVEGKIECYQYDIDALAALGFNLSLDGCDGTMYLPSNSCSKLGFIALSRCGVESLRSIYTAPANGDTVGVGQNVETSWHIPDTDVTPAAIRKIRVYGYIYQVADTTLNIAADWVARNPDATSTDMHGYYIQGSDGLLFFQTPVRAILTHGANWGLGTDGEDVYDAPGLNYVRAVDGLMQMSGGHWRWAQLGKPPSCSRPNRGFAR
jgi:hypothetical protein